MESGQASPTPATNDSKPAQAVPNDAVAPEPSRLPQTEASQSKAPSAQITNEQPKTSATGEETEALQSVAISPSVNTGKQESQIAALTTAASELNAEIEKALAGEAIKHGASRERLMALCTVIDYWIADDTAPVINDLGLETLAAETKRDYVLASFLAWRGEYKLSYITLRSFLESFCLLLYYLNQGCDRLLYLRGKGYKLMLHRMAQKKQEPDDMHAFRRHYHLLIAEGSDENFANKFFEEINACYSLLSKAVHGDYTAKAGETSEQSYFTLVERILRICNTLALHDPMLVATEDDIENALDGVLVPVKFQTKPGK